VPGNVIPLPGRTDHRLDANLFFAFFHSFTPISSFSAIFAKKADSFLKSTAGKPLQPCFFAFVGL
jgi:hypothetical protein